MSKMNVNERATIWQLFTNDFAEVDLAINKQIDAQLEDATKVVRKKWKIDKADAKIKAQEKKCQSAQDTIDEVCEGYMKMKRDHNIEIQKLRVEQEKQSTKLTDLRDNQLGDLGEYATAKTLRKLNMDPNDRSGRRHYWHSLPCSTELEALVCLEVKSRLDIEKPTKVMNEMRETISREFAFCTSKQDARELYEKFHGFNWQRYGANIAPLLSHVEGINGKVKLLPAGKKLAKAAKVTVPRKK